MAKLRIEFRLFCSRADIFGRAGTKTLGSNKFKGHKDGQCGWKYPRRSESAARAKVKAWSLFQPQQQHQATQGLSGHCKELGSYFNCAGQCGRLRNDPPPPKDILS